MDCIDLIPLGRFLKEASLTDLQKLEQKWSGATEFLKSYKEAKAERIANIILLKKNYDLEHPANNQ
jgi:hypothetical protein